MEQTSHVPLTFLSGLTITFLASHTLQLGAEKAMKIPSVQKALAHCHHLVGHFNHSAKACYLLKKKQDDIQSIHSYWMLWWDGTLTITQHHMYWSSSNHSVSLSSSYIEETSCPLTQFSTLECYRATMKPLVDITEAIGAQKWVTISTILPLLHKLLKIHLKLSPESDSQTVKQSKKQFLLISVQHRK